MLISVRLLAHDAREAVAIVAEAGGVADQKSFGIFQQRLERVGIFAAVVPGEDCRRAPPPTAGSCVVQEVVHQVDAVAHPLVGDAAGEFFVQAEFEIELRIERTVRLGQQPASSSPCPARGSASLRGGRASAGRDSSTRFRLC